MSESTGTIDFIFHGETFKTWYRVVGDLKSGRRPLILLHGGPGVPSTYMFCLDGLASSGTPLVYYDQVGCGQSTHLSGKPKEFWTYDLFMDELENVLTHFGIADDYDLLGHSWGGMLAADFITARHPKGIRRLILSDSPASMELWEISTNSLLDRFPKDFQETVRRHTREGTTHSPEYEKCVDIFNHRHLCTVEPWPKLLIESFTELAKDNTVYATMNGPSEFTITGTIKSWTVVDRIHHITCPTLIITGVDDEAQDICVNPFFEKIDKVKWVKFAKSSHMPFFEESERYLQVVNDFLATV